MKEFDKIYVAKYEKVLTTRQLAEDLRTTQKELLNIIENLKAIGMIDVYKNIPDEEWEKLERQTDEQIRFKYYKYSETINKKYFMEILEFFEPKKPKFLIFDQVNYELKGIKDSVIIDEKWKKIPNFDYSMSNYGRTRNDKTKKIKSARIHRWMVQTDIYKNGKRYTISVPRAVASLFIRPLESWERVKYIDGDKRNNYYKNLEIVCM